MEAESNVNECEDDQENGSKPMRRSKEGRIGEVVEKVLQWRRLYTGVVDPATGQMVKLSLQESAARVGVEKRTLDDYLLQIR